MLQPAFNNLLVKILDGKARETKSAGGIVIPEKVQKTPLFKGEVLAVGPGYWHPDAGRVPICCEIGDVIYFRPQDFFYLNQIDLGQALVPDTSVMAIERSSEQIQRLLDKAKLVMDATHMGTCSPVQGQVGCQGASA